MKSGIKPNGTAASLIKYQPLFIVSGEPFSGAKLSVQQALAKWYAILNKGNGNLMPDGSMFAGLPEGDLCSSLKADVELIPVLLMEEFISSSFIFERGQYIKLVQALLTNISNEVYSKINQHSICTSIEITLEFLQNFFYQYFDIHGLITQFRVSHFRDSSIMKLDYLQLKLNDSQLTQSFKEAVSEHSAFNKFVITWNQFIYLQNGIHEIETRLHSLSETVFRDFLYYHNFNAACFIEYELQLIQSELQSILVNADKIAFLQSRLITISQLKVKATAYFCWEQPSVKKQLSNWIDAEIKQLELKERTLVGNDMQIAVENKIQTTLSVAKLAVLIRLLVVDKIIVNPTVAPMLKTVSKLFTTLQKDEISFGSLETKYHAPDKSTLSMMKEIMQKWVGIIGKL